MEVGFLLVLQNLAGLLQEFFGYFGSFLTGSVFGDGLEWWHTGRLRIGVFDVPTQSRSAKDDDKAMLFYRFDKELDSGDLDLP